MARLVGGVLADEERSRLTARQIQGEPLKKHLQVHLPGCSLWRRLREASERIHHHEGRVPSLNLADDHFQPFAKILQGLTAQVDEVNAPIHFSGIKEVELLPPVWTNCWAEAFFLAARCSSPCRPAPANPAVPSV